MATRVLLTTTSYQDTPGPHHELLESQGFEVVRDRGPLSEERMLELSGEFDAFLCGDDAITRAVVEKSLPRLKVISKYGIGLDKIDVDFATSQKIPVLNTPGVNHTTVAEHTFGLLICITKRLIDVCGAARNGEWKRITGHEVMGKKMGIIGLGRIGKEVAIRAKAFAMPVIAFDPYWDSEFAGQYGVERCDSMADVLKSADVISLHCFLDEHTRDMVNAQSIADMQEGAIVLNCARGELVNTTDMVEALNSGKIGGYGTDVLDEEPPPSDHPLLSAKNCVVSSHIGSRTFESVERQAMRATNNLINYLNNDSDYIQANKF